MKIESMESISRRWASYSQRMEIPEELASIAKQAFYVGAGAREVPDASVQFRGFHGIFFGDIWNRAKKAIRSRT